jgi:hypothetical protein
MSVNFDADRIFLRGACRVEEAETLAALLIESPGRIVDVTECGHLHAAVCQVLLALRPRLHGAPADTFVRHWVLAPLFGHGHKPGEPSNPALAGAPDGL